jgi:pumilio family protein 6
MEGDPTKEDHPAKTAHGGRLLRALVAGGHFDPKQKKVLVTAPDSHFADALYKRINEYVLDWATGDSSFTVVALAEAQDFGKKEELRKKLRKGKSALQKAATATGDKNKGNAGARILLKLLDE